ncbi:PIR Superfamily Protein [Plasmodium ovale wallikeri]|uniref:Plasmodium vivax Vir protein, putative n=2 Tax=Plasmodium ovale TaxID=36330 RepID=A0A1C3KKH5_PLAOA|nr:PIR Superfamily Protein [Plasmodium ovale wallikeri]SBT74377.1 Plasmodium vivax Vir protein, putative [Plasmodium ovale]
MENRIEVLKKKLISFNFDLMLNKTVGACENCDLCKNVNENIKDEPWFKCFCYQFARNVQTLYEIPYYNSDLKERRCDALAYWVHDRVKQFSDNSNINKTKVDIVSEILNVWSNINSRKNNNASNTCNISVIKEYKNLEEMKRKKIMSSYCENYDNLRSPLKGIYSSECHIYYDYFKDSFIEFSEIVNNHKPLCLKINHCSRFCKNHDPDDLLNKSKCKIVEISQDQKEYIKGDECEALKEKAVAAIKSEPKEVQTPEFTFSDKRAIILILFSLWGIFLTFLYFYKMTPLRSWISSKLGKKELIRDNFNEQNDDVPLDADYESVNRNMENGGYNITYNSNWNPS